MQCLIYRLTSIMFVLPAKGRNLFSTLTHGRNFMFSLYITLLQKVDFY